MYFSYNQFLVFDVNVRLPGLSWDQENVDQGFARQGSNVAFLTLIQFGTADVRWEIGPYLPMESDARVIGVPFAVTSGTVRIQGPTEGRQGMVIEVEPGNYRLVAAQEVLSDEEGEESEAISLFFEPVAELPLTSEIIVADGDLKPTYPLTETAEPA